MELDHLALQVVDARGRGRDVVVEDVLLHLLDVVLDRIGDRDVVVHDLVEDRPDGRGRPKAQEIRTCLQSLPCGGELAAQPMPHRDHVPGAGEEMDLTEVDDLAILVVMRRLEDDEDVLVVVLDLRSLMWVLSVLDGELVEPEQLLQPPQIAGLRLVDPDPDELAGTRGSPELGGVLRRQRLIMLARAVLVVGAVDDHRPAPRSLSVRGTALLPLGAPDQLPSSTGTQAASRSTRLPLKGTPSASRRRRC